MTNELIVAEVKTLSNVPDTILQNSSLAERAKAACTVTITAVRALDMLTAPAEVMEAHDANLATLQTKLGDATKIMLSRRTPFTKFFDVVRSKFTDQEKIITETENEVKTLRSKWQAEKSRRNEIAAAKVRQELAKANEATELKANLTMQINANYLQQVASEKTRMINFFYSLSIEDIQRASFLNGNFPTDNIFKFAAPVLNLTTVNEYELIRDEVISKSLYDLQCRWDENITEENNRLRLLIPGRIDELETVTNTKKHTEDLIASELKNLEAEVLEEASNFQQAIATEKETEQMDALFEASKNIGSTLTATKGATVKRKYNATTHAAHVAIIQYWVKNCMSLLTIDELNTKLSFMKTSAEAALNKGVELTANGLLVEENHSVRRSTKKAA